MARKKTTRTDKDAPRDAGEARMTEPPESDAPVSDAAAAETSSDAPDAPFAATEDEAATVTQPDDAEATPSEDAATAPERDGALDEADRVTPEPDDMPDEAAPTGADEAPPAAPAPVVRTEQVTVRQGGFWSMLLGGIAAAGIGVFAAPYVLPPDWFAPQGVSEAELDAQAGRIAALEERLAGLAPPADQSGEIDGLSQTLTDLTGRIAEIEARVGELAARPAPQAPASGVSEGAVAALEDRLAAQGAEYAAQQGAIDALRAEIAALRGEAEAQEAAARDSAQAVLRRAALTRIRTALDTGEGFAPALADLRETGAEVPEALAALAENGAPTRAALAESFPEAARAALAAARAEAGEGTSVTGFLRSQLGVRSLTPREGEDPDAVLSRAEAALSGGRLAEALAEIEALPETARAPLADWAAQARSRAAALAAAEALLAAMN